MLMRTLTNTAKLTTMLLFMLLQHAAGDHRLIHDESNDTDKALGTMVIDDVIWLATIVLIAGTIMWLCCFWDTPPVTTPTHCNNCCSNGKVIRVRIEHDDRMEKSKHMSQFTRPDDYDPSTPDNI